MDRVDLESAFVFRKGNFGSALKLLGRGARFAEGKRHGHAVTAGMGGGDQFLGVRAGFAVGALEAGVEGIALVFKGAAQGGERPLAVHAASFPDCGCAAWVHETPRNGWIYKWATFRCGLGGDLFLFRHPLLPCLLYTSPSPRDRQKSRMPSSA